MGTQQTHTDTRTGTFSLPSLWQNMAFVHDVWGRAGGSGLMGLWEWTWINGLSFNAAWGEQSDSTSRRCYIRYQRAFGKRLQLKLPHIWGDSYSHACQSQRVFEHVVNRWPFSESAILCALAKNISQESSAHFELNVWNERLICRLKNGKLPTRAFFLLLKCQCGWPLCWRCFAHE